MRNPRSNHVAASIVALLLTCTAIGMRASLSAQSPASANGAHTPLVGPYLTWINQDVVWIMAADERAAYISLPTNSERLQFIKDFWDRRNPNPGSSENMFKQEHYRRLAYANRRFASNQPGWESDRGRIYIIYGKPDSIDAHPSGGNGEGGPFEVWHYNQARSSAAQEGTTGNGVTYGLDLRNADLQFTDTCRCGDYKLTSPLP
ncbi:GWxTD domain-containing protein [Occallatibacter riparius]|uniref:GWxTD domain-containing protein n=1 Tax=Occallatibacter riparius TaxID=1002689 RepID=A0A9J7BUW5_9BACT|nr:GWxTD domain-containing protein [Occallatibacter riparius]UWZ86668.1 GWxTD domain-containing protein [Occallatibacter riparius]